MVKGFTLLEIIVTMVLVSILSIVSANFITSGFEFYVDASTTQKMTADANFVSEKIEKYVKNSVPNSFVISESDTSKLSFVPIVGALGFTYDHNDLTPTTRTLYALVPPSNFLNSKIISNYENYSVAFNTSCGAESCGEQYYDITSISTINDGSIYKIILKTFDATYRPISEFGRLFFVEKNNRFRTICLYNKKIKLISHTVINNFDCSKGDTIADNVNELSFYRVSGAYNQYGEIQIKYVYDLSTLNAEKVIYQRIGVNNAP